MLNTFDVAHAAALEAGAILSRYFREGFTIRNKGVADLVTDADVAAERRVVEVIRAAFPDHAILAEEENAGDSCAEHLWVVTLSMARQTLPTVFRILRSPLRTCFRARRSAALSGIRFMMTYMWLAEVTGRLIMANPFKWASRSR